jgi:prepilin-type N-terminal cleavage/methylation domain-containing protein
MNALHRRRPHYSRGFTLMESILVMIVLGLASLGIIALQGRLFTDVGAVDGMQVSTRLMHECGEQVLAQRRHTEDGYANVVVAPNGSHPCSDPALPPLTGFTTPAVDIQPYTGGACPANFSCKTVVITEGGLVPVTVMLVDY